MPSPLVAGGIAAGGAIIQGLFNRSSASDQRRWAQRMSNTAYQRAVRDMQRAGLNPALAYQQGGASSPAGASAATLGNPGEDAVTGYSTAVSARSQMLQTAADIARKAADTRLVTAQARQLEDEGLHRLTWWMNRKDVEQMRVWQGRESLNWMRETLRDRVLQEKERVGMLSASAREARSRARLQELAAPQARNAARAADTWLMQKIAPFLSTAWGVRRLF